MLAPELMEILRSSCLVGGALVDLLLCRTALDLMRCILPDFTRLWISITRVRSSGNSRLQHISTMTAVAESHSGLATQV